MMTLNTKLGVALLAFFSTSGSAVAAAAADDNNNNNSKNQQLGRKRRTTTAKTTNLRKGNHRNNLATKQRQEDENNADITEDVAFWTRELQVGSMRPVTRRPTPRPTRRPTPNVTPNPVTPFPTEVGATPNPTDAATTPNPTDPADTPNPTTTPETPEPTPAPTVTITPAPSPTPPASGPVARDDDGVMNADDGIAFFSVLDNDTPAPGESLFVQSVDDGSNGLCTIGLDLLQVTFIPDVGFDGTDSCVYEACDSVGACDTATLTVVVEPPLAVAMWLSMPLS